MSEMYVQEATQKISFPIAQHIVDKINPLSENHVNLEALRPIFDGATMLNPGIEIYLLNPVGMILASSVPSQKLERPVVSLDPIKKALSIEEKEFILSLSCPELREYTESQIIDSKLYFGHDVYLSYAEERYYDSC